MGPFEEAFLCQNLGDSRERISPTLLRILPTPPGSCLVGGRTSYSTDMYNLEVGFSNMERRTHGRMLI